MCNNQNSGCLCNGRKTSDSKASDSKASDSKTSDWKWTRVESDGSIAESSLTAGKVLCRFWYDAMPPEAHLIAAAQDLRDAIERLMPLSVSTEAQLPSERVKYVEAWEAAHAALAKAKGQFNDPTLPSSEAQ